MEDETTQGEYIYRRKGHKILQITNSKQVEEKDSAKEREGRSTGRGSQGEQMLQEENCTQYDVSQVVKDLRVKSDC